MKRTFFAAGLAGLWATAAFAQGAPNMNTPAAKGIPVAVALEAAQIALDTCKANGYAVTVTVVDSADQNIVLLRADGARPGTIEIGRRKAYTVIKKGMSSGDFGKSIGAAPPAPPAPGAANAGPPPMPVVEGDPSLVTFAGGVPIKKGNEIVAAISVSGAPGGDKDEACIAPALSKIAGKY